MKSFSNINAGIKNLKKGKTLRKKLSSEINPVQKERYTDKDLEEFRVIIESKLEEATADYELLKTDFGQHIYNNTISDPLALKVTEENSDTETKEQFMRMVIRQEKLMEGLRNALLRIENKTYGICIVTGKLIPKGRLKSIPQATFIIEQN